MSKKPGQAIVDTEWSARLRPPHALASPGACCAIFRAMPALVSIKEIVEMMDSQTDESSTYLDPETGRLYPLTNEVLRLAESGGNRDKLPEWQQPEFDDALFVGASDRVVGLPSKWDIHEWEIMRDFALSVEDDPISDALQGALRGGGAFRRFREAVRFHDLEDAWRRYREQALRQIAIEWCEERGIPCRD
jgi:hypothetical protein